MRKNKHIDMINSYFSKYEWYREVYSTRYKNEYVIIVNEYPYTYDYLFFKYEVDNKIRIRIQTLG